MQRKSSAFVQKWVRHVGQVCGTGIDHQTSFRIGAQIARVLLSKVSIIRQQLQRAWKAKASRCFVAHQCCPLLGSKVEDQMDSRSAQVRSQAAPQAIANI
jgi:hypothetical protein